MVSFENLLLKEGSPIYMQIMQYIEQGIASGSIKEGDEMPSRRKLSALLGVNPNTVQKAYALLEKKDIVVSNAGAKSYVKAGKTQSEQMKTQFIRQELQQMIAKMQRLTLEKEEVLQMIDTLWEETGEET